MRVRTFVGPLWDEGCKAAAVLPLLSPGRDSGSSRTGR